MLPPTGGGGWEQDNDIIKGDATKLLGNRILGGPILPGSLVLQDKLTTVMAMPMARTRAPFDGAAASLGGREGIDLPEDTIHHDASCNRLTSF
jgi:hypothetical protein